MIKSFIQPAPGYSFVLRPPKQTANQIRRSYKNDQSNIFVLFISWHESVTVSQLHFLANKNAELAGGVQ